MGPIQPETVALISGLTSTAMAALGAMLAAHTPVRSAVVDAPCECECEGGAREDFLEPLDHAWLDYHYRLAEA